MKTFIVTIIDKARRKRSRIPVVAQSWWQRWNEAINEHGLNVVISVRPAK